MVKQNVPHKAKNAKKAAAPAPAVAAGLPAAGEALSLRQLVVTYLLGALFFLVICLSSASTAKGMAMLLLLVGTATVFFGLGVLREHVKSLLMLLTALVLMDGISTLYAISGKFALFEYLKVISSFCLVLIMLVMARGRGWQPGRRLAMVLEGAAALASLVSIDLISTRWFSGAVLGLLGAFTPDYQTGLDGLEVGVRMTSIFSNPNIFAGCIGLGVLLTLGLVLSSGNERERAVHIFCLFVNALGFMLAFSMGASGVIALAFWVYLILELKEKRASLLMLMLETLLLTVAGAAVVSITSFGAWQGVQPVPLLLALLGAAPLYLLDRFVGRPLAELLNRRSWLVEAVMYATLTLLVLFGLLAYHLTGAATLQPGESLRRSAYPEPGTYTLNVAASTQAADIPLEQQPTVYIESQNQQQTMMHTSTPLYQGPANQAQFTVPEGSLVVYFSFGLSGDCSGPVLLEGASYQGEAGSGEIPLGYKLLPGFVANRLQGLSANENAIQRLVFFEDGMKLWQRSPLFGLGLGAFENGIKSVQSFYYETKYAHNHYIQTMVETGVIGLALFVGLLLVAAVSVVLARKGKTADEMHPLVPALGAAVVFMAGHAATEVVFSTYSYLPMAFGVFALLILCCDGALPLPRLDIKFRTGYMFGVVAMLLAFALLLGGNLAAARMVASKPSFESLASAAALDKYEWADYELSYVRSSLVSNITPDIRQQADKYAEHLATVNSNTIPIYLAEYYFSTNRPEQAFAMLEKYADYVASDAAAWQSIFSLLQSFEQDRADFRQGVGRIVQMLNDWNEQNMGQIQLDEEAQAFVSRMTD